MSALRISEWPEWGCSQPLCSARIEAIRRCLCRTSDGTSELRARIHSRATDARVRPRQTFSRSGARYCCRRSRTGDRVGGFDLALLHQRSLGQTREAFRDFGRIRESPDRVTVPLRLRQDEAHVRLVVLALHRLQHPRGRRRVRIAQARPPPSLVRRDGAWRRRSRRALRRAQRQSARTRPAPAHPTRTVASPPIRAPRRRPGSRPRAAASCCCAGCVGKLLWRVGRTVLQQAMQQEHVEDAHGLRVDAHRAEWIEVHQPHLDVLDTAFAQRVQRTLARADTTLGPDRAVELVFDLQHAVRQLMVAVAVANAHAPHTPGRG